MLSTTDLAASERLDSTMDAERRIATRPGRGEALTFAHALSGLSGLALAICFFLPFAGPDDSSPLRVFWVALEASWFDGGWTGEALLFAFCGLCAMHLLGGLVFAEALGAMVGWVGLVRLCRWGIAGVLATIGFGLLWALPGLYLEECSLGQRYLFMSGVALSAITIVGGAAGGRAGVDCANWQRFGIGLIGCVLYTLIWMSLEVGYGVAVAGPASLVLALSSAAELLGVGAGRARARSGALADIITAPAARPAVTA